MANKRRQRQRRRKNLANAEQGPHQEPDRQLIEAPADMRLLRKLMGRADYIIPPDVFDRLGWELWQRFRGLCGPCNGKGKRGGGTCRACDGSGVNEWSPNEQLGAARLLRQIVQDNVNKDRANIQLHLHSEAQKAPEAPERQDDVIDGESQQAQPVAFVEALAAEDAEATWEIIRDLKLEEHLFENLPKNIKQGVDQDE